LLYTVIENLSSQEADRKDRIYNDEFLRIESKSESEFESKSEYCIEINSPKTQDDNELHFKTEFEINNEIGLLLSKVALDLADGDNQFKENVSKEEDTSKDKDLKRLELLMSFSESRLKSRGAHRNCSRSFSNDVNNFKRYRTESKESTGVFRTMTAEDLFSDHARINSFEDKVKSFSNNSNHKKKDQWLIERKLPNLSSPPSLLTPRDFSEEDVPYKTNDIPSPLGFSFTNDGFGASHLRNAIHSAGKTKEGSSSFSPNRIICDDNAVTAFIHDFDDSSLFFDVQNYDSISSQTHRFEQPHSPRNRTFQVLNSNTSFN
jgi:hypothetical protein